MCANNEFNQLLIPFIPSLFVALCKFIRLVSLVVVQWQRKYGSLKNRPDQTRRVFLLVIGSLWLMPSFISHRFFISSVGHTNIPGSALFFIWLPIAIYCMIDEETALCDQMVGAMRGVLYGFYMTCTHILICMKYWFSCLQFCVHEKLLGTLIKKLFQDLSIAMLYQGDHFPSHMDYHSYGLSFWSQEHAYKSVWMQQHVDKKTHHVCLSLWWNLLIILYKMNLPPI